MSATPLKRPVAHRLKDATSPAPGERDRLIHRAKTLSWLSLAYMTAEGAIGVTAAILAGSVALLGFGLDSAIEALASVIVIWRFTGSRRLSQHAERRAERMIAASLFLLAPYIAQDASHPDRRRAPRHQLARDRPIDLEHHRHAPARQDQTTHRPATGLRRHGGRRHPEPALCLPRHRSTRQPRAKRRLRPLVGRSRRRARHRRPRHQRRPANLARRRLLRRTTHQHAREPPATTPAASD